MDETKYQVFVSSTYVDLIDARKKVIETVLSLYHFPVGMEMFSADDSEQWDIIKETIDASDYYVIVIGHKYGSVSDSGISYTEREYDYAKSLGIPVLAFIRKRELPTLPGERESNPENVVKLERFIQKAQANKMCDFWEQNDDLATKVAIALPKIMRRNPRVGWVRGDKAISREVSNELAELSTENRKLREKLREYESQLQTDLPTLKLSMINEDLKLNVIDDSHEEQYFSPLTRESIPSELNLYISDSDIDHYNGNLPSNEDVDKYNRKLFLFNNYELNSITLTPSLENIGRKVATDIYINISLPSFLVALKDGNKKIFTNAPALNSPENPIKKAKEKLKSQTIGALWQRKDIFGEDYLNTLAKSLEVRKPIFDQIQLTPPVNQSQWVKYDGDNIILRANKLIQSLSVEFDDITLIPIAEGEGVINIKIICEEFKEPVFISHQVTVNASN